MLTVLMATYNGSSTLTEVLESYLSLVSPLDGWKLIVIDNASTDGTAKILESFTDKLPMTSLYTEKRGKNHALNLGLNYIEGDLVVFTDDDTIPDKNWLVQLELVAKMQPEYDVFGGVITPIWMAQPEEWILKLVNLGATFGITPKNINNGSIPADQVWGANMAVRRRVFLEGHFFYEGVGPQPGQYIMGSEVEFTCRIEKLGYKAWFNENAVVGHMIRPHQIEQKWIIERAYRLGRHMFHREHPHFSSSTKLIFGVPRWNYRNLLSEYINYFFGKISQNFDKKFLAEWEISYLKGYIYEGNTLSSK